MPSPGDGGVFATRPLIHQSPPASGDLSSVLELGAIVAAAEVRPSFPPDSHSTSVQIISEEENNTGHDVVRKRGVELPR
jgi:hypothetical protein